MVYHSDGRLMCADLESSPEWTISISRRCWEPASTAARSKQHHTSSAWIEHSFGDRRTASAANMIAWCSLNCSTQLSLAWWNYRVDVETGTLTSSAPPTCSSSNASGKMVLTMTDFCVSSAWESSCEGSDLHPVFVRSWLTLLDYSCLLNVRSARRTTLDLAAPLSPLMKIRPFRSTAYIRRDAWPTNEVFPSHETLSTHIAEDFFVVVEGDLVIPCFLSETIDIAQFVRELTISRVDSTKFTNWLALSRHCVCSSNVYNRYKYSSDSAMTFKSGRDMEIVRHSNWGNRRSVSIFDEGKVSYFDRGWQRLVVIIECAEQPVRVWKAKNLLTSAEDELPFALGFVLPLEAAVQLPKDPIAIWLVSALGECSLRASGALPVARGCDAWPRPAPRDTLQLIVFECLLSGSLTGAQVLHFLEHTPTLRDDQTFMHVADKLGWHRRVTRQTDEVRSAQLTPVVRWSDVVVERKRQTCASVSITADRP